MLGSIPRSTYRDENLLDAAVAVSAFASNTYLSEPGRNG